MPMRLLQVSQEFQTDDQCLDYIEARRWSSGICCIHCGSLNISRITRTAEKKGKNRRSRIYQCLEKECGKQFSTTSGTIFDGTHLPLPLWFKALSLILEAKKGMSAKQVQRHLDIPSYKTAWFLCHRIRKAMKETGDPLTGTVEIDETYVGGKVKRRGERRGLWRARKEVVVGMVERGGRLRFQHIPAHTATSRGVKPVIETNVSADADRIMTDDTVIYPFAFDENFKSKHHVINHSRSYGIGDVHTNTIENAFSLLKRGILGSYHKVSLKHLHRYCSEFEYRFNHRGEQDAMFAETMTRLTRGTKLPFKSLTA
jgi:hypothetical protein